MEFNRPVGSWTDLTKDEKTTLKKEHPEIARALQSFPKSRLKPEKWEWVKGEDGRWYFLLHAQRVVKNPRKRITLTGIKPYKEEKDVTKP